jgi:hypothetical protein
MPGACWVYPALSKNGYARVGSGNKVLLAHRVIYEALVGPIPAGLVLDHLCANRACVNPAHLEPVTKSQNAIRGGLPHFEVA